MKIFKFLLLFFLSNIQTSYSQDLKGLYKLYDISLDETYPLYINFNKNNFVCFSLGSSIKILGGSDELKWIGTGNYKFKEDKIILEFKTDSNFIIPINEDSILVAYNSTKNQNGIKIYITFNNLVSTHSYAVLIIETAKKEYTEIIKPGVQKIITIEEREIIKSIKISAIEMPFKYLPFDLNFNTMKYTFFAIDKKSQVKTIKNQTMEFIIKKNSSDSLYRLENKCFLKKVDNKELEFLKLLSTEKEIRLKEILNYSIK